jgi:hypothetical protein
MKKMLMTAVLSGVLLAQSSASFAGNTPSLPTSQGLCHAMPSWTHDWLPCKNG